MHNFNILFIALKMEIKKKDIILITGITGFLGSHIAKLFLENDYFVRGTVRDLSNSKKLTPLKQLKNFNTNLQLFEADLLLPNSWFDAVKGCSYVIHVASPFPSINPKHENEIIEPAVSGTLSVLKACKFHNVKHVVLTSSVAAVQSIGKYAKKDYTEDDWTYLKNSTPYYKSKTMAEKAAWDYYESLPKENRFRLTTILPGLIFGPSLVTTDFTSGEIIRQLLTGEVFAIPKINYGIVDVRDVALAHMNAILLSEKTDGQRFICCSEEHLWFDEIAQVLKQEFNKFGYKVTTRKAKYYQAKLFSLFNAKTHTIIPFWGLYQRFSNEKIKKIMNMKFRPAKEAILEMAYSMIKNQYVPNYISRTKL